MTAPDPLARRLDAALATIRRGATFLEGGLALAGAAPIVGPYRARLTGNGLRELDRFLNLLLDVASEAAGNPSLPGQANTAAKYQASAVVDARSAADHRRLLALGRSRACLCYCDGIVRRPDTRGGASMTLGWRDPLGNLGRARLGEELCPGAAELRDVAHFYHDLADRIVDAVHASAGGWDAVSPPCEPAETPEPASRSG